MMATHGFIILYDLVCSIIIILALLTARAIWRNYKTAHQIASLMLFIYIILIFVAYLEQALVMTLSHLGILITGSVVSRTLTGICCTVGNGVAAAVAIIFAILILKPKHAKAFCIPPLVVATAHCLIWAIFGVTQQPVGGEIVEWFPSLPLKGSMIAVAVMAFIPAILFFVYGMNIPTFRQEVGGLTLSIGFLILGYFVFISDNFAIAPPILYRRICIALGVFVVYLGFTTPRWYLNLLKRVELGVKKELKVG
jgi:hypothetical protein